MITSTERHKLVSSRERGQRVLTLADIDFRVVEECCAVITAPFLVGAAAIACEQILTGNRIIEAERFTA